MATAIAITTKNTNARTMMTEQRLAQRRRTRHVARSARILSTGLSATAVLGITAAFGAAEKAQSAGDSVANNEAATAEQSNTSEAGAPSALAPLGTPASAAADQVTQFPSPEGTVTLPSNPSNTAGASVQAQSQQSAVIQTAPAGAAIITPDTATPNTVATTTPDTTAPVATLPPDTTLATVAPIAPAEPPTQLTLPPAPSRGSSGGSH